MLLWVIGCLLPETREGGCWRKFHFNQTWSVVSWGWVFVQIFASINSYRQTLCKLVQNLPLCSTWALSTWRMTKFSLHHWNHQPPSQNTSLFGSQQDWVAETPSFWAFLLGLCADLALSAHLQPCQSRLLFTKEKALGSPVCAQSAKDRLVSARTLLPSFNEHFRNWELSILSSLWHPEP